MALDHTETIASLEASLTQLRLERPESEVGQKAVANLIRQTERKVAFLTSDTG